MEHGASLFTLFSVLSQMQVQPLPAPPGYLPMKLPIVIEQHGIVRFAICILCGARFESKLLKDKDAEEEIARLYRGHVCRSNPRNGKSYRGRSRIRRNCEIGQGNQPTA